MTDFQDTIKQYKDACEKLREAESCVDLLRDGLTAAEDKVVKCEDRVEIIGRKLLNEIGSP